jgi:alkylhydroperoxidase family enzyme
MQRLNSVNPEVAEGRTKELLETVEQAFGVIPNTAKVMANSPAVLGSFLAFSTAMGGAKIGEKLHNQVKLTTSETNSCDYCTSILTAVAPSAGLSAADILAGRTGKRPPGPKPSTRIQKGPKRPPGRLSKIPLASKAIPETRRLALFEAPIGGPV